MWALLFVTFIAVDNHTYSYSMVKHPYNFNSRFECGLMRDEAARLNPSGRWSGVCIEIKEGNTK